MKPHSVTATKQRKVSNVIISTTGELHGSGSDPYKWVSYLRPAEKQAVKDGELVLIWDAPTHGGNPPYRKVVYQNGRYNHRVPTQEEQEFIKDKIKFLSLFYPELPKKLSSNPPRLVRVW